MGRAKPACSRYSVRLVKRLTPRRTLSDGYDPSICNDKRTGCTRDSLQVCDTSLYPASIPAYLMTKENFSIVAVAHKRHHNLGASWAQRNFYAPLGRITGAVIQLRYWGGGQI